MTTTFLATRRSQLALIQTEEARRALAAAALAGGSQVREFQVREIASDGDTGAPLTGKDAEAGYKGLFTHALNRAVLRGECRFAVHSCKDLPHTLEEGIVLAAVLPRGDARDALVLPRALAERLERRAFVSAGALLHALGATCEGFCLGTSAPRRTALATRLCPALNFAETRGNIPTRLLKLQGGEFAGVQALMLAVCGLERLGLLEAGADLSPALLSLPEGEPLVAVPLSVFEFPPAAGQGFVGICVAEGDGEALALAGQVDDPAARLRLEAERAVLVEIEGDCSTAVAAYAVFDTDSALRLSAFLEAAEGGSTETSPRVSGPNPDVAQARALGREMGKALKADCGADHP